MDRSEIEAIFEALAAAAAAPVTDVGVKRRRSPFRSLVACLLSAQSRDANTKRAADALFERAATPAAILALDEAEIARLIRPCGLYNTKARNLKKLCRALVDDHGGVVPSDRAGLMALPGIGRKCADIMLRFVFEEAAIAVDTHVFRVATRIGLSDGRTAEQVARDLEAIVPERFAMAAHLLLLEHGKRICRARAPRCAVCPVAPHCRHYAAHVATPDAAADG
jgi:endonuclease III